MAWLHGALLGPLAVVFGAGALGLDVLLAVVLLGAEVLAWFGAVAEAGLARFRRGELLEAASPEERPRLEATLARLPALEFTAQLARYLGNAVLVVGLGWIAFRGAPGGGDLLGGGALAGVVALAFALTFVLNDVLARVVAERNPERVVRRALPALERLAYATTPFRLLLGLLVRVVFRLRLDEPPASAREEVRESVEEGAREGSISREEREMIGSIIDLHESRVEDVMTPRSAMVLLPDTATLDEAIACVNADGYSRIPVYRGDREEVVGILYARDLLLQWRGANGTPGEMPRVGDLMREAAFVPSGKSVADLLQEMRAKKVHIAVVVDDHAKVAGVVTIEDLLEEIVGDIQDEHDEEELPDASIPPPEQRADGSVVVDARTAIEDLNASLGAEVPEGDDFETVGGLLFHRLGRVPVPGDRLVDFGLVLSVVEADERTARRVSVERERPAPEAVPVEASGGQAPPAP